MGNKRPMHRHSNEFKRPDLNSSKIDQTIRILEKDWKRACHILNQKEKVFVDTYLGFLRSVARICLQAGWRVWFRPNQVVHWGEGGFGHLSIFVTGRRKANSMPELPAEVELITKPSNNKSLGEEITLTTLDRITYEPDQWL
jgi:hypothetical protein